MAETSSGPSLSVALCTHNGARYIAEQVTSILAQEVAVTEIVLSDDASTDDTVAIAEAVVAAWPAPRPVLRVVRNRTALGVTANFEQASLACTGEFIALCDQDDAWHPDKIAEIMRAFARRPEIALVHSDAALVDDAGDRLPGALFASLDTLPSEIREIHAGHGYQTLLRRNLVTGATVVFRAALLQEAVPFGKHWIHDEWLGLMAGAFANLDVVERELIDYRQHGANQIGARNLTIREKFGRLGEPRSERNQRILDGSMELLARVAQRGADPRVVALAEGKVRHERFRSALPGFRIGRTVPVIAAWARGTYSRFGRGNIDVLRDLLQPPD